MAITLGSTTKSLELETSVAGSVDYAVSYNDVSSNYFSPGDSQGNITTATTTVIVSAPPANVTRGVKSITVYNNNATANTIRLIKDVGGTQYVLFKCTLDLGESLVWSDGQDWGIFDSAGRKKVNSPITKGNNSRIIPFYKVGSATDAAAYWYSYSKDNGFPGAWSPGSAGVNGRNTSGTSTADAGCLPLWTPGTGNLYLTDVNLVGTTQHYFSLMDVMWVNNGLTVTATTAQTITMSGPLPARDLNGTVSGEGCLIGVLTTTNNTNAGVVNNSTISYTNSSGTPGRTATLTNLAGDMFPATPVIGTVVFFQLAAGDTGVQSIQSITLGTSLGGGAISLFIARPIIDISTVVANTGAYRALPDPGIRLYPGSCLIWFYKSTTTTLTTINGSISVVEK